MEHAVTKREMLNLFFEDKETSVEESVCHLRATFLEKKVRVDKTTSCHPLTSAAPQPLSSAAELVKDKSNCDGIGRNKHVIVRLLCRQSPLN